MKDLKVMMMMMMMMMMMIDDDEIAVISLHCLLFSMSKNKYLKQISKSATKESIEISLDLKVCFSPIKLPI